MLKLMIMPYQVPFGLNECITLLLARSSDKHLLSEHFCIYNQADRDAKMKEMPPYRLAFGLYLVRLGLVSTFLHVWPC